MAAPAASATQAAFELTDLAPPSVQSYLKSLLNNRVKQLKGIPNYASAKLKIYQAYFNRAIGGINAHAILASGPHLSVETKEGWLFSLKNLIKKNEVE